ncbi:MAG: urea carboxylase-associated family protein [Betaproteobacteria bacterium]|nr:urea carboxylase-associated family protein [Betaproteobacteria bacterium]
MKELIEIPARCGIAVEVPAGQSIRVVNTHGGQVVDMWAFRRDDPSEHMSMPHSVVTLGRIKPAVGDSLVSNLRRPVLRLVEDTSPGVHCMLFASCDPARYRLLGCTEYHDNCADNLRSAVAAHRIPLPYIPTPLNLFMNTKFDDHRVMRVEPPEARPGDRVTFRAEHDCIVALSACPQDLVPVNAHGCTPTAVAYAVFS